MPDTQFNFAVRTESELTVGLYIGATKVPHPGRVIIYRGIPPEVEAGVYDGYRGTELLQKYGPVGVAEGPLGPGSRSTLALGSTPVGHYRAVAMLDESTQRLVLSPDLSDVILHGAVFETDPLAVMTSTSSAVNTVIFLVYTTMAAGLIGLLFFVARYIRAVRLPG